MEVKWLSHQWSVAEEDNKKKRRSQSMLYNQLLKRPRLLTSCLETVRFQYPNDDQEAQNTIQTLVTRASHNLVELEIAYGEIFRNDSNHNTGSWETMIKTLPLMRHLKRFRVDFVNLGMEGVEALAEYIESGGMPSIEAVHFHSVFHVFRVVRALCNSYNIKTLVLTSLLFKDTGFAESMIQLLPCLKKLETLRLCWNDFEDKDILRLVPIIGQCASLTHLDLKGNHFGEKGQKAILHMAQSHPSLEWICLSYQWFWDEDIHAAPTRYDDEFFNNYGWAKVADDPSSAECYLTRLPPRQENV